MACLHKCTHTLAALTDIGICELKLATRFRLAPTYFFMWFWTAAKPQRADQLLKSFYIVLKICAKKMLQGDVHRVPLSTLSDYAL